MRASTPNTTTVIDSKGNNIGKKKLRKPKVPFTEVIDDM